MKCSNAPIDGLIIIEPDVYKDNRGFFLETYHVKRYEQAGIFEEFLQDNLSYSRKGVLRGLHFQKNYPQAKLVQVCIGEVFDVVVDLRRGSSTFGHWFGITLTGENLKQLFIPKGFAHGFCVLSDYALFCYKCSDLYVREDEGGLLWSDPEVDIKWPVKAPIISEKDAQLPRLSDLDSEKLPSAK